MNWYETLHFQKMDFPSQPRKEIPKPKTQFFLGYKRLCPTNSRPIYLSFLHSCTTSSNRVVFSGAELSRTSHRISKGSRSSTIATTRSSLANRSWISSWLESRARIFWRATECLRSVRSGKVSFCLGLLP